MFLVGINGLNIEFKEEDEDDLSDDEEEEEDSEVQQEQGQPITCISSPLAKESSSLAERFLLRLKSSRKSD
jgi:hypothetical protein